LVEWKGKRERERMRKMKKKKKEDNIEEAAAPATHRRGLVNPAKPKE
jgi:hypothetical protein